MTWFKLAKVRAASPSKYQSAGADARGAPLPLRMLAIQLPARARGPLGPSAFQRTVAFLSIVMLGSAIQSFPPIPPPSKASSSRSSLELQSPDTSFPPPSVTTHYRICVNTKPPISIETFAHFPRVFCQLTTIIPAHYVSVDPGAVGQVIKIIH